MMQLFVRCSCFLLVACAVTLSGCTPKPKAAPEEKATPTPAKFSKVRPDSSASTAGPFSSPDAHSPKLSSQPVHPTRPNDDTDEEASPQKVAELERRYMLDTEGENKLDIIFELNDMDIPAAYQSLTRLLMVEKNPEMKSQILMAVGDSTMPDDQKVTLVSQYVGPEQAKEVREMAVEALDEVEDARAIVVWQRLVNDQDADIRETARAAVERLRSPATDN